MCFLSGGSNSIFLEITVLVGLKLVEVEKLIEGRGRNIAGTILKCESGERVSSP